MPNSRSITPSTVAAVSIPSARSALRIAVSLVLTTLNLGVVAVFGGTHHRATSNHPVWFLGLSLLFVALFGSLTRVWIVALRRRSH